MTRLLALAFAGVLTAAPAAAFDAELHGQFVRTATDIAAGADRHDWARVRSAMADRITTDYTSLFGGEPTTQAADDLIKGWAAFLPGFESTHHLVTNHAVTGQECDGGACTLTAEADFVATHRIGDALWVLGGRYSYRLDAFPGGKDRLLVTSLTMQALWETGDRAVLIGQAMERAKAR